tara:strand:+ start:24 stop:1361 length:1338 start_codon:yes stop_codon:yes gene_type:complete
LSLRILTLILSVFTNPLFLIKVLSIDYVLHSAKAQLYLWIISLSFMLLLLVASLVAKSYVKKESGFLAFLLIILINVTFFSLELIVDTFSSLESLSLFQKREDLGFHYFKPNIHSVSQTLFYPIEYETNSLGMPWKEVLREKEKGKYRIGFIGASLAMGLNAESKEKSFVGVFDSLSGDSIELLNFSCPGYGIDNQIVLYQKIIKDFNLDHLVYCFANGVDIRNTYLGLKKNKLKKGLVVWNEDEINKVLPESLSINANTNKAFEKLFKEKENGYLNSLIFSSNILKVITSFKLVGRYNAIKNSDLMLNVEIDSAFTAYTYWSNLNVDSIQKKAINKTLMDLSDLISLVREDKIQITVLSLPYYEQVYFKENSSANYSAQFPQSFIKEYCQEHRVEYLDALPMLRTYVLKNNSKPVFFYFDAGHYNNEGHKLVGRFLNDELNIIQ